MRLTSDKTESARAADCYLIDGLLVEPTYCGESSRLRWERFAEAHASEIRAIAVTHWHLDHCRALHAIAHDLGATIFGPKKDQIPLFLRHSPVETIQEGDVLLDRWRVLSAPGHDPDHIVLFDGETLIAGDALSNDLLVHYDRASLEATRAKLTALKPKHVLTGHP
jgi:glyoxylase-like metal-dependent hydrolase (beta-lactamase superfamily II)